MLDVPLETLGDILEGAVMDCDASEEGIDVGIEAEEFEEGAAGQSGPIVATSSRDGFQTVSQPVTVGCRVVATRHVGSAGRTTGCNSTCDSRL